MKYNRTFFTLSILSLLTLALSPSAQAQFTQQGAKLTANDGVGDPRLGAFADISADGNTVIAGGFNDDDSTGAAWIFTRSGSVWTQQGSKLVGTGAVGKARQGISVALSADGNTAIIGGYIDDSLTGAAWIFTRSGTVWSQQGSKLVGTGATGKARQGYWVDISDDGNTAIVGGIADDSNIGAVWIFTRTGGVWSQQGPKLVGTGYVGTSRQGSSVALSGDGNTAIVGGYTDDSFNGATWVFTRSDTTWTQQGPKLIGTGAIDPAFQGCSVRLSYDGNTAIVGAYGDDDYIGAAWIFTRIGNGWSQEEPKLVGAGVSNDASLGTFVTLSADGNTAVAAAPYHNTDVGGAWVFTRTNGTWTQQGGELLGSGTVGGAYMGQGVSLSGDARTLVFGGPFDDTQTGAIWIFTDTREPDITLVEDIPGDQGGQVRITWDKSPYDTVYLSPRVTSYSIYRQATSGSAMVGKARPRASTLLSDSSLEGYDHITDVPALQLNTYQKVVPTLEDSSGSGTPYFNFLIVARTEDVTQYYVSAVDSGYSVDNLSPIPPAGLLASVEAGPQVVLSWNAPTDPDVQYYKIYRSTTGGFSPTPGDSIGTSGSVGYTDTDPEEGAISYYRIVAVDVHDNESGPSNEAEAGVTVNSQFGVQSQWNIVSVPLTMGDYTKTVLFPTATTSAFTFEDGYVAYGTLENGRGYWMKFSSGETISHDGLERTDDTIAVAEGWNMVGSVSSSMAASSVGSIPGGIVTSNFFGYDGGYSNSVTLEPGKGYWVKVSQAGQLVMSSAAAASPANRIRIDDSGELPPPPPDQVSAVLPSGYALEQNYPNPFNPVTTIRYALPVAEHVRLTLYNIMGQEVAVLVNELQEAGFKAVSFDAGSLPSGVYTCRITAGNFTEGRRMILLK